MSLQVDDGLVRYIKERLGEGYKESHIREVLYQHGNSQESVDAAFGDIHRLHATPLVPLLLVALLLVIGVLLFFLLRPESGSPGAPPIEPVTPAPKPTSDALSVADRLLKEQATQSEDETYYATVKAATSVAASTADGILLCSVNKRTAYKNYCLQKLAEERRLATYCEIIGDARQRDECYLGLIWQGEDQYCAKLILEENKRICSLLLGEK